jgi:hypothetical protein
MSISFTGPKGWIEQRWIVYALLRDNVQHHIEGGTPTGKFQSLHSIAEALGGKEVKVPAGPLHEELLVARPLLGRPIEDLAISLRTRAVLSLHWPPPERRETMRVTEWGGTIPLISVTAKTLDDVFGHLLEGLIRITEEAPEGTVVDVIDL